jgi:hypothetical protein
VNEKVVTIVVVTASAVLNYLLTQPAGTFSQQTLLIIGAVSIALTAIARYLPTGAGGAYPGADLPVPCRSRRTPPMRRVSVLVALLFLVSVQGAAAAYRPLDAHHSEALCDPGHAGTPRVPRRAFGGTSQQGNDTSTGTTALFICYGANIADLKHR